MYSIIFGLAAVMGAELVEVGVDVALIAKRGFDDNDRVEAVLVGELPNPCMTLGETRVDREGAVFKVRQMAWSRSNGSCAPNSSRAASGPVPYWIEVPFGRLEAADYLIRYRNPRGERQRVFRVAAAETDVIDDYNYAHVSDVIAPDLAIEDEPLEVTFRGVVDTSCAAVGNRIKLQRQDDVLVVLPIESLKIGADCTGDYHSYSRKITLPGVPRGLYLLHLRSKNGKAVNRVFSVYPRT
jgi:hypothetical protein